MMPTITHPKNARRRKIFGPVLYEQNPRGHLALYARITGLRYRSILKARHNAKHGYPKIKRKRHLRSAEQLAWLRGDCRELWVWENRFDYERVLGIENTYPWEIERLMQRIRDKPEDFK